jgi:uncharacterized protein (TIGR01244 family)
MKEAVAMIETIRVSDRLSVGGQPNESDLDQLAERGFKAVVNLRIDNEANQPISPEAERAYAESAGLTYRRLPITPAGLRPHQVEAFRKIVEGLPGPIYVHCGAGQRASAISILAEGISDRVAASLLEAARQGIAFGDGGVQAFIRRTFDNG